MEKRNLLIWNIILLFTFLVLIVNGFKLYAVYRDYRDINARSGEAVIGTDRELERIIDFLEERLKQREEFQFVLKNEPLNLTNVVYLTDDIAEVIRIQMRNKIRVSCIVAGKEPTAIVQYQGRNYLLSVGDQIAGGIVRSINSNEMVLLRDGEEIHYPIQGLTITQQQAEELLQEKPQSWREEG